MTVKNQTLRYLLFRVGDAVGQTAERRSELVKAGFSLAGPALLSLMLNTGCSDSAADMQRTANKAQAEADTRIDIAKDRADQEARTAQAKADEAFAASAAAFSALREDYRHSVTLNLVDLDKKVAEMEASALKANGKRKASLQARLTLIGADREVFVTDYASLDRQSAATWDATRARLDSEWAQLIQRVEAA